MKRSILANCLRGIVVLIFLIMMVFYLGLVPETIRAMGTQFPEFEYLVIPGIVSIGLSSLPITIALTAFWKICDRIAKDQSFCRKNITYLMIIGICALIDTIYCFVGMVVFGFLGVCNPGTMICALGSILFGLTITVAAMLLSHLVKNVSVIEEEVKFTV